MLLEEAIAYHAPTPLSRIPLRTSSPSTYRIFHTPRTLEGDVPGAKAAGLGSGLMTRRGEKSDVLSNNE